MTDRLSTRGDARTQGRGSQGACGSFGAWVGSGVTDPDCIVSKPHGYSPTVCNPASSGRLLALGAVGVGDTDGRASLLPRDCPAKRLVSRKPRLFAGFQRICNQQMRVRVPTPACRNTTTHNDLRGTGFCASTGQNPFSWALLPREATRPASDTVTGQRRDDSRTLALSNPGSDPRRQPGGHREPWHRDQRRPLPAPIASGREADGLRARAADLGATTRKRTGAIRNGRNTP